MNIKNRKHKIGIVKLFLIGERIKYIGIALNND